MPHLISEASGDLARQQLRQARPFGPGLSEKEAAPAEHLRVIGSSFNDPGEDWCEFQWFDPEWRPLGSQRIGGY